MNYTVDLDEVHRLLGRFYLDAFYMEKRIAKLEAALEKASFVAPPIDLEAAINGFAQPASTVVPFDNGAGVTVEPPYPLRS